MGMGGFNGGIYAGALAILAGLLLHILSFGFAIIAFIAVLRRRPRVELGFSGATASLALSCFSTAMMVLVVWWAGGTNLFSLALLSAPSVSFSVLAIVVWKLRTRGVRDEDFHIAD